jgi:hypothetical protein
MNCKARTGAQIRRSEELATATVVAYDGHEQRPNHQGRSMCGGVTVVAKRARTAASYNE